MRGCTDQAGLSSLTCCGWTGRKQSSSRERLGTAGRLVSNTRQHGRTLSRAHVRQRQRGRARRLARRRQLAPEQLGEAPGLSRGRLGQQQARLIEVLCVLCFFLFVFFCLFVCLCENTRTYVRRVFSKPLSQQQARLNAVLCVCEGGGGSVRCVRCAPVRGGTRFSPAQRPTRERRLTRKGVPGDSMRASASQQAHAS